MSSSEGKHYYCSIKAEFGRMMPDGSRAPKNPIEGVWLDLDYGEAVAFQAMVLKPAITEITDSSLELGIRKAVADGQMDQSMANTLLSVAGKEETRRR